MSGNVDEADDPPVGPLRICKPEIDAEAAALFLGQAVRIDPRQRLDQRGFAMIDVTGGTDEH